MLNTMMLASKMVQWIKVLPMKSDGLNLIPRIYMKHERRIESTPIGCSLLYTQYIYISLKNSDGKSGWLKR